MAWSNVTMRPNTTPARIRERAGLRPHRDACPHCGKLRVDDAHIEQCRDEAERMDALGMYSRKNGWNDHRNHKPRKVDTSFEW